MADVLRPESPMTREVPVSVLRCQPRSPQHLITVIVRGQTLLPLPVSHTPAFLVPGPHFLSGEPTPSCVDLVTTVTGIGLAAPTTQLLGHRILVHTFQPASNRPVPGACVWPVQLQTWLAATPCPPSPS